MFNLSPHLPPSDGGLLFVKGRDGRERGEVHLSLFLPLHVFQIQILFTLLSPNKEDDCSQGKQLAPPGEGTDKGELNTEMRMDILMRLRAHRAFPSIFIITWECGGENVCAIS